jgi:hypothetical protein
MYKNSKEADHAFYVRYRDRLRENRVISPKNGVNPRTRYCPPETAQEWLNATSVEAVPDTGARVSRRLHLRPNKGAPDRLDIFRRQRVVAVVRGLRTRRRQRCLNQLGNPPLAGFLLRLGPIR